VSEEKADIPKEVKKLAEEREKARTNQELFTFISAFYE